MNRKSNFSALAIQAALITSLTSGSGFAWGQQEDADNTAEALIEEVTVTARKREESLQAVPMAVTAFGEKQIEAAYIGLEVSWTY
jgi:iron complex outermembrane receptor protein